MHRPRWKKSALNEATTIWLDNPDLRAEITAAIHHIDQQLSFDPSNLGESRDKGRRVFFVPPVGVQFKIVEDKKEVWVLRVWKFNV